MAPTTPVSEVLSAYPVPWAGAPFESLGNYGGFSGARLWRVTATGGRSACLRLWPPQRAASRRLPSIHRLMGRARASGCLFVPEIFAASDGRSLVDRGGRLWELSAWLPGRADFHQRPSDALLGEACRALARLHAAWTPEFPQVGPVPAIARRLALARDWADFVRAAGRIPPGGHVDSVLHWGERGWEHVNQRMDSVSRTLAVWHSAAFPLQPCLCDIWHDHVLFDGEHVTGICDYGAVKLDHVAVDLARLLGSMAGNCADLREAGLTAYRQARALSPQEEALVRSLDETGAVLAIANWLMWLYRDQKQFKDHAVSVRLQELIQRLDEW